MPRSDGPTYCYDRASAIVTTMKSSPEDSMDSNLTLVRAAARYPYGGGFTIPNRLRGPLFAGFVDVDDGRDCSSFSPRPIEGKLNLTTKEAEKAFGSKRLFQRLRHAGWIKALFPSRDALYPVSRVLVVQRRLESGELPPRLPSEVKQRAESALN